MSTGSPRVLVITADLGGNVPPVVAVAEALVRRGAAVEIAGLPPGRTELPQVRYPPADAIRPPADASGKPASSAFFRLMGGRSTASAATALVFERAPDIVVVDCMAPAPIRGALESGRPVVILFHTFGEYWTRSFDRGLAGRVLGLFGMRPGALWRRASARLLLTDAELDPAHGDRALSDDEWTGTTERGAPAAPRGARPRVLVTLSSAPWPGMLDVYRRIVTALATLPVDAVVTTGRVPLGGAVPGAANVEVHGWMPHDEILPGIDLVIGHGGHSTTMKTLAHGIPLLIMPVNPTSDQRLIGDTVETAGLGRRLRKTAHPVEIADTTRALLDDHALRARAARTGERLRSLPPGAEVAAARILAVGEGG